MGGIVCGCDELIQKIYHYREINGAALHPMSAYLLLRGMKTLSLRINYQNESALVIARFLSNNSAVESVFYPGLENHPHHEVAVRQMRGFGGVQLYPEWGSGCSGRSHSKARIQSCGG